MTGGIERGLDHFNRTALEAVRTGGALYINRHGRIAVIGRHALGRTALRIKQYLLPHRMRAQNINVLNLCAATIQKAMQKAVQKAPTPPLSTYTCALAQTLGYESRLAHILAMKTQLCRYQLNALTQNRKSAERIFNALLHASAPMARRRMLQDCDCPREIIAELPIIKSKYQVFVARLGYLLMPETAFSDELLKDALRIVLQKHYTAFQTHGAPTWLTRVYDASFPPAPQVFKRVA